MEMTGKQFDALVKLMRGTPEAPANQAARRVLVDGVSKAEAERETGASRSTVYKTVKRYREAYELMRKVFSGVK